MLCLSAPSAVAQRQHIVSGAIVDSVSAAPIPFADIWLMRDNRVLADRYVPADSAGRFSIQADGEGRYALYIRRLGYASSVALLGGLGQTDSLTVTIRLAPLAVTLPEATVRGHRTRRDLLLSGFDRRRELGLGAFLTYDEIQQRGAPPLPDLLREIPGVTVNGHGTRVEVEMSRASVDLRRCQPLIYMDGQLVSHSSDAPSTVGELLSGTPGAALEAVEVYRGRSELPAEFSNPDARCGAIVVWTHRPDLHRGTPQRDFLF